MKISTDERHRQALIANVLATARRNALPVTLAAWLDTKVRVHDPVTDQPVYIQMRAITAGHVRCP